MGRTPYPIRGNVVRLTYNPDNYPHGVDNNPLGKFIQLMVDQGSAVSHSTAYPDRSWSQLNNIHYWRGAVVTSGIRRDGFGFELQKDGDPDVIDSLVEALEEAMQVKFKRRTIRRSEP